MNKSVFIIITALFFVSCSFLGMKIYQQLDKFQRYKIAYTSELNFQSSLLDIKDYLSQGEWKNSKEESLDKVKKALKAKEKANSLAGVVGLIIIFYGLFFYYRWKKEKLSSSQFGLVILNCCVILLGIGITIPFIEIGAFMQDLKVDIGLGISQTFEGKMYFFYQCKSVLNLIQTLFQNNNYTVAISILLFSIIAPFVKLFLYYIYVLSTKFKKNKNRLKFISYVGKFSMADVFVAACFLAFLSFSNLNVGVKTESSTLLGLYFFLGYCIVSIAVYFVIGKKITTHHNSTN